MGVRLGNGNWAVKTSKLLAYNDASGMFFNKEFDFTRATTATRVNKSGLIESVATNVPRIDFTDDTKGYLLLEPASTNKITESENAGGGGNSAQKINRTGNAAVAPDGTTTADLIIPNTITANHQPYQYRDDDTSTSFVSGSNYAWSVFVKSNPNNGAQFVQMHTFVSTAGSDFVTFDIINGTITQTGFVSSKIEDYGNGWFRCSIVFQALRNSSAGGSDGWSLSIVTASDSSRAEHFAGDLSSNGVLVWGAQFEEQIDFATSYIPTDGSAATRNAEICNGSGAAQDFNSTEGVLYGELARFSNDLSFRAISLNDGSTSDVIAFKFRNSANVVMARVAGASTNKDITVTTSDISQFNKLAISYSTTNDISKFYINGVEVGTISLSGVTISGLNGFELRQSGAGEVFCGKIRELRIYRTALTDSELIALTT